MGRPTMDALPEQRNQTEWVHNSGNEGRTEDIGEVEGESDGEPDVAEDSEDLRPQSH